MGNRRSCGSMSFCFHRRVLCRSPKIQTQAQTPPQPGDTGPPWSSPPSLQPSPFPQPVAQLPALGFCHHLWQRLCRAGLLLWPARTALLLPSARSRLLPHPAFLGMVIKASPDRHGAAGAHPAVFLSFYGHLSRPRIGLNEGLQVWMGYHLMFFHHPGHRSPNGRKSGLTV